MPKPLALLRPVSLAAALLLAGTAQAAITEYNTLAGFQAAVLSSGTDGFDNLPRGSFVAPPLSRSAGSFAYQANATVSDALGTYPDGFFNQGTVADVWLSTDSALATITFSNFGPGTNAIGGSFFLTNSAGAALGTGQITLVATDASGSVTRTLAAPGASSFYGFVSDVALVSLTVTAVATASTTVNNWPTVNNLVLATVVPEPQTYALMLGGLLALGALARRRRG